jgi:hypothetical protein
MTPWVLGAEDSLKRLLQGVVVGALITMILGFTWGGWVLGSTNEGPASERARSVVTAPLVPVTLD